MAESQAQARCHVPVAAAGALILVSVSSRSATSILTPVWLDALNNHSDPNVSSCDLPESTRHIDAYPVMFIATLMFVILFGIILLFTKCVCPYLITERETEYDKRVFAVIGVSDTVFAICIVYASSGCRTAPYLQSLFSNFSIPLTFIIRYLVLRKRPTCKKTICAILILFAEFTALLPDIFPGLESQQARKDQGGASGIGAILWPVCYFCGYIPMAIVTVALEKAVKSQSPARRSPRDTDMDINVAYCLFWCYLFSFLTLMLLFWTDLIPGFGMTSGILEFSETFWFNLKCFVGLEGCRGAINVISAVCIVLNLVNRVNNMYFLRYLEGANYLAIITSIQTPMVFLFFTLFDENPLKWHPHAYLSTWLSLAALCIMIPAIYIYDTGAPEIVSKKVDAQPRLLNVDDEVQTDENFHDTNQNYCNHPDDFDDTSRLLQNHDVSLSDDTDETPEPRSHSVNTHQSDTEDTTRLLHNHDESLPVDHDQTSRLMYDTPIDFDSNLGKGVHENVMADLPSSESTSVASFHSCIDDNSPKYLSCNGSKNDDLKAVESFASFVTPFASPKSSEDLDGLVQAQLNHSIAVGSFESAAENHEYMNGERSETESEIQACSVETLVSQDWDRDMKEALDSYDAKVNCSHLQDGSPVVVMKYGSNCLTLQDDILRQNVHFNQSM